MNLWSTTVNWTVILMSAFNCPMGQALLVNLDLGPVLVILHLLHQIYIFLKKEKHFKICSFILYCKLKIEIFVLFKKKKKKRNTGIFLKCARAF